MCGIFGWLGSNGASDTTAVLTAMGERLRHRGPDNHGMHIEASKALALGHNRLSIIDLSDDGRQPMVHSDTGDVLVFNGEIYNFVELREHLRAKGIRFRSRSDTEVLLHAIATWGMDCLARIEGMYAFAVWRPSERSLYLVRDPLGIKPIYYIEEAAGRHLTFASEIKAFLALPYFKPRVDTRALGQFLEFGYVFDADRTSLQGVRKLPPGHVAKYPLGGPLELRRFFAPALTPFDRCEAEGLEHTLYERLSNVVEQHLVADVPVGLLLSGGLDSSLLAALAARRTRIRTISMGFAGSSLDERPQARIVADYIASDHEEVLIEPGELRQDLAEVSYYFDDLFADWGTVSTRLLYKKCRERGVKVVIVGEGSDELFGGYDMFRPTQTRLPADLWLFNRYRHYAGRRYGSYFYSFRKIMREHLKACEADRFGAIRLFETQQQLPNNYVMKVDKASMSVSVEARVPYLDKRIAEIAYRIPSRLLLAGGSEKAVLRRIAARHRLLPESTISRPKFGGSMASSWMDDHASWRRYAQDVILDAGSWTHELKLGRAMREYFIAGRAGFRFPHAISLFRNLAWRLLILELWSRAYRVAPNVQ